MRALVRRIKRWLGIDAEPKQSFDEVLREACDVPMLKLSAQALSHSLLEPTECGQEFNRGIRRKPEATRV